MSDNYFNQRVRPLQSLYAKLESICSRHVAISAFDCGDLQDFGSRDYSYPMVYLETITEYQENDNKNRETYSVALNILDRQPDGFTRQDMIATHDRLKQLFTELKGYMETKYQFGDKNISPAQVLVFNDFDDDKLVRLRGEFTITVDALLTDPQDYAHLFPEL